MKRGPPKPAEIRFGYDAATDRDNEEAGYQVWFCQFCETTFPMEAEFRKHIEGHFYDGCGNPMCPQCWKPGFRAKPLLMGLT